MGNRLSKIYTRTGDDGTTGLGDGSRVNKDDLRVEVFGDVDELNSSLGLLLTNELPDPIRTALVQIQHDLFDLGGELCIPGHRFLTSQYTDQLELKLDQLNAVLDPLKDFILPGGNRAAAYCHLARTVCRRAERKIIRLNHEASVNVHAISYLNRLSDYLFVAARYINHANNIGDVLWNSVHSRSGPSD